MTLGLLLILCVINGSIVMVWWSVDAVKSEVESLKNEQRETNRLLTQIRDKR